MSKKHFSDCNTCIHQETGFDGGFDGSPFTCECNIFGETRNRKNCERFKRRILKDDLFLKVNQLKEENEQLRNTNDYLKIFNSELQVKLGKIMQIVDESDYFSDEAIKHDTIAYIEMSDFDNRDAYEIACAFKKIKEVLRDE